MNDRLIVNYGEQIKISVYKYRNIHSKYPENIRDAWNPATKPDFLKQVHYKNHKDDFSLTVHSCGFLYFEAHTYTMYRPVQSGMAPIEGKTDWYTAMTPD